MWSSGDIALTEAQMTDSAENVAGPWRYERLDGPGHWMQLEAPDTVNRLLLDFLPGAGAWAPGAFARGEPAEAWDLRPWRYRGDARSLGRGGGTWLP